MSSALIYQPTGRAREYADLALNLYRGCDHQCVYCYAPDLLHMPRAEFGQPKVREQIFKDLVREAGKLGQQKPGAHVLLCFTCDPYCRFDEVHGATRMAIQVLHAAGLSVTILTKGGQRSLRDLDLLTPMDAYGITLTFLDAGSSLVWEPFAALPAERIRALREFKAKGVSTWVSLEPVLDPWSTLEIIEQTHHFVDHYNVGVLNYHARALEIDWRAFALQVKGLLDRLGCSYYLKDDLRRYLAAG